MQWCVTRITRLSVRWESERLSVPPGVEMAGYRGLYRLQEAPCNCCCLLLFHAWTNPYHNGLPRPEVSSRRKLVESRGGKCEAGLARFPHDMRVKGSNCLSSAGWGQGRESYWAFGGCIWVGWLLAEVGEVSYLNIYFIAQCSSPTCRRHQESLVMKCG